MVDASPPLGLGSTGRVEPVSEFFFVADHHADPAEVEARCREHGVRRVRHSFVGLPVGSTSSFLAALGIAFGVRPAPWPSHRSRMPSLSARA